MLFEAMDNYIMDVHGCLRMSHHVFWPRIYKYGAHNEFDCAWRTASKFCIRSRHQRKICAQARSDLLSHFSKLRILTRMSLCICAHSVELMAIDFGPRRTLECRCLYVHQVCEASKYWLHNHSSAGCRPVPIQFERTNRIFQSSMLVTACLKYTTLPPARHPMPLLCHGVGWVGCFRQRSSKRLSWSM